MVYPFLIGLFLFFSSCEKDEKVKEGSLEVTTYDISNITALSAQSGGE